MQFSRYCFGDRTDAGKRLQRCAQGIAMLLTAMAASQAGATTLTWDSSGTSPAAPVDGSGPWDTASMLWSNGTTDVAWSDGNAAVIGSGNGTAAYTIALGAAISASNVTFNNAGASASYTISPGTFSLTAPLTVESATVTLGTGTFVTNSIAGNSASSTVIFNGATLQPTTAVNYPNSLINGTTDTSGNPLAMISTGGLTIDTSAVPSNGVLTETDPITTAAAAGGSDGGLTKTGAGILVLGSDENGIDPQYTYKGPTNVTAGTLALDTVESPFNPTGAFPSTSFNVGSGATLSVYSIDAIDGESGATPVTLNGGTLTTYDNPTYGTIPSAYLANVTLNGGAITSDFEGEFIFLPNAVLHVTAGGTLSAANAAFETGATINVDLGSTLTVSSPLIDDQTAGQITTTGAGTVILQGNNSYSGDTTVSAGTLILAAGGSLTATTNITVAANATFELLGTTTSQPNLAVTGNADLGANTGTGILTRKLNTLSLGSSATSVVVDMAANHANRQLVILGASGSTTPLVFPGTTDAWIGQLDVTNNDLDIENGNLANITNQIKQGFNGGDWIGEGITSSTASTNPTHLTALGVILNNNGSGIRIYGLGTTLGLFDGANPAITDVLVKYTYYGDANLDGQVDGSDYTKIDAGFNSQSTANPLTGWYNGDFNYDGQIDGSDYTLIDNAFNTQGGNLSSSALIADSTAQIAGTAAVPEPAMFGLLTAGMAGLLAGRRRR
jgi:autotransporter-associated beta strand protein